VPCFPDRPLCLVNFKHFSSFLQRYSGLGRAAKSPDLRSFASGNTQYKLTLASTFPEQGVSPLTRWDCRPQPAKALPCQWALPLDPNRVLRPCTRHKGIASLCTPAPAKLASTAEAVLPVSPAPYPHVYAHRREVDTEYVCGNCRSKQRVQTRCFFVNRPHFRQFFLLSG